MGDTIRRVCISYKTVNQLLVNLIPLVFLGIVQEGMCELKDGEQKIYIECGQGERRNAQQS